MMLLMPKLHSDNFPGIELIRPLYMVEEASIISWKNSNNLTFINCACKFTERNYNTNDGTSKRKEIKELIKELKKNNPSIDRNIFTSMNNVNLNCILGTKTNGVYKSFLEDYDKEIEHEKEWKKTNVIRILEQNKINFKVYNYINSTAISGTEVADYLGEDYNIVFKTLVTIGKSGNHYVFLVPVNKELDLKKAAVVVEEKSIEMIKSKELLPLTGYIHGGCSPVGMKKYFPTVIDKSAKNQERIIFSGGKIGYQIDTTLEELAKVINYTLEDITKDKI